jgi:8-oxo-dGTP diphosphatase/2-hydroxy-dATP diphosphatase
MILALAEAERNIRSVVESKFYSMEKILMTLCLVYQHPKILLGMKKRGFGAGRWNGFGGKLAEGENLEDAARRELKEEAGISIQDLEKSGVIEFEFQKTGEVMEVHIFKADKFSGEIRESEEMKPQWFDVKEIPFSKMWPDDIYWMPMFLEGKKFTGKFLFGENDVILEKELKEINKL